MIINYGEEQGYDTETIYDTYPDNYEIDFTQLKVGQIYWAWCERSSSSNSTYGKFTNKSHGFIICRVIVKIYEGFPFFEILKKDKSRWMRPIGKEKDNQYVGIVGGYSTRMLIKEIKNDNEL